MTLPVSSAASASTHGHGFAATPAHAPEREVIESADLSPQPKGFVMIGRVGIPELVIILFIIILIFGANRLPEIGRGIGKGIRNFKEATRDGQNDRT
jgi:sec-independent protein translocase protein TatA